MHDYRGAIRAQRFTCPLFERLHAARGGHSRWLLARGLGSSPGRGAESDSDRAITDYDAAIRINPQITSL